jgi:hypothetical protein
MLQGRVTLPNGLTVNCAYELAPDGTGRLSLFAALWTILNEGDAAALTLSDNTRLEICIVPRFNEADAEFKTIEHR